MDSDIPFEERLRALKYCSDNLSGSWKSVPLEHVQINRLSGGMSNILYRCVLSDRVRIQGDEPRDVLLRLYGPARGDIELHLDVFKILAAQELGPKLYGHFEEGCLEEYLPSNPLTWSEMTSNHVSAAVARKIAASHKLTVDRLTKNDSIWLLGMYNKFVNAVQNFKNTVINPPLPQGASPGTKAIAEDLIKIDLRREIEFLEKLLTKSKTTKVFSHNDLHQNNILLLHETANKSSRIDDRIVLIDFEYCSYNYCPFDLANHLNEWCFDYNSDAYPFFTASVDRFPSVETQRRLVEIYLNELGDFNPFSETYKSDCGDNGVLTISQADKIRLLFEELQVFFMASNLLWTIWAIYSAYTSKINFGYWEMAKWKYELYLFTKKNYLSQTSKA